MSEARSEALQISLQYFAIREMFNFAYKPRAHLEQ